MSAPHDLQPDSVREAGFPTVEQLRQGIVLDCIVHSFWLIVNNPAFYMIWEGDTYYEDTLQGEHWAVSFPPGGAVAVFFSNESPRNPFPDRSPPYDQSRYFRGLPSHLEPARNLALSCMHDLDFGFGDPAKGVITAAMWADGERFTAVEPWDQVYFHSSWACRTHLLPPEEALREWWQGIGFPESLRAAAWSLFVRRVASTAPAIQVEPGEWWAFLEAAGGDQDKASRAEGMLADVGIILEPCTEG